ncbi:hypothetical protein PoB_000164500 [Plakobranchus ocellatus]|uniref:Uncharacterized protein n=1 Tax=Plakobranchus ocellatus TaxID=259542 RepID=A0AAV3XWF5_9GAST|nr:hypothetical protein PoB_000164500 [Plakobranchus ocellatus]
MANHQVTVWTILGLVLVIALTAQAELKDDQKRRIRDITREINRCTRSPGLSLSLLDLNNQVMHEVSEGRVRNQAMSAHHTVCVGDATQAFSAVLLGMLIDSNEK